MIEPYVGIASNLAKAASQHPLIRRLLLIGVGLVIAAIVLVGLAEAELLNAKSAKPVAAMLGASAGLIVISILGYQRAIEVKQEVIRIEAVERRVVEDPKATQAAWELAQVKLENYLNRNLAQVRSIYWLIIAVMGVGFLIVGYGIARVYDDPKNLLPSVVAAASGIIINFIGATFLVIYRSTMEQAKEYVVILERINAVGMSIQILDNIEEDDAKLRTKMLAEIARDILSMYGVSPRAAKVALKKLARPKAS